MDERAFIDRNTLPTAAAIKEALGKAHAYYAELGEMSGDCVHEWKYLNRRYGWVERVSRRKKPLYAAILLKKHFLVNCHLKAAERAALMEGRLLEKTRKALESAREFPEGLAVELGVNDEASFADAKAVIGLLLAERP